MSDEHPIGVALENRLMSDGIYVTSVMWLDEGTGHGDELDVRRPPDGAGLAVEYETVAETATVTSQEVSAVVRTLLSIADEREWTPGRVEATAVDDDRRGEWYVDEAWFAGLDTALSELEFSDRVLGTRRTITTDE